jgi:DNA-binding CsgD family transcriptional regulator
LKGKIVLQSRDRQDAARELEDYIRQIRDKRVEDSYDLLTLREREILQRRAEDRTYKKGATIMKVSIYTVETHRGNILGMPNLHFTAFPSLPRVGRKLRVEYSQTSANTFFGTSVSQVL